MGVPRARGCLLFASVLVANPAEAREIHVDGSACTAPGTGTAEDPFCAVQDAVDAAVSGDVVLAAPGRYTGRGSRPVVVGGFEDDIKAVLFLKDGVDVAGSGPGRSVLDAEGSGTVVVADRLSAATSLSGFTLRGSGRGSSAGFDFGDGVFVNQGSPVLSDLEIEAVEGGYGAVDVVGPGSPVVERSIVRANGSISPLVAGILVSDGSAATIRACILTGNRGAEAGGLLVRDAGATVENCVVAANQGSAGGGIKMVRLTSGVVRHCTIAANTSGIAGAGVRLETSSPQVRGSVVVSNRSLTGHVGGIFMDAASLPVLELNDVHGNLEADYPSRSDPTGTGGNISSDPLFVDFTSLDLRLSPGSPAIDASAVAFLAGDLGGTRRPLDGDRSGAAQADMGAWEFDRWDVHGLAARNAPFALDWQGGDDASGYALQRGDVRGLPGGDFGACLTPGGDLGTNRFEDPDVPAPGEAWFYLVVARVGGALQTLGFDSSGVERIARPGNGCSTGG